MDWMIRHEGTIGGLLGLLAAAIAYFSRKKKRAEEVRAHQ
jgi:LPXTG-motif cell wall-anchored protein